MKGTQKTFQEKMDRARELLKSRAVYEAILNLMGNPWGTHKFINMSFSHEGEVFEKTPTGEAAHKAQQQEKITEMVNLIRYNEGLRFSIAIEIAQNCRFVDSRLAFATLEYNLNKLAQKCVKKKVWSLNAGVVNQRTDG